MPRLLPLAALTALWLAAPDAAHAQYKNNSFGLDAGYMHITRPTLFAANSAEGRPVLLPPSQRPLRLRQGFRLAGEGSFKLSDDRWWFVLRINLNFMRHTVNNSLGVNAEESIEREMDAAGEQNIGTVFAPQPETALRYYFLTDRVRPYVQAGISFMHLFSFSNSADADCVNGASAMQYAVPYCQGTNADTFLAHPNILALHVEPGLELIVTRDIALHLFAEAQRWLVFNAADNWAFVASAGVLFYM